MGRALCFIQIQKKSPDATKNAEAILPVKAVIFDESLKNDVLTNGRRIIADTPPGTPSTLVDELIKRRPSGDHRQNVFRLKIFTNNILLHAVPVYKI